MSKKDEYGLEFIRITSSGNVGNNCVRKDGIVDYNNLLQFISYFDIQATQKMIEQIDNHLNGTQPGLNIQFLDNVDLDFLGNQLVIDEQSHTFPLADIKILLQEWLVFLQS